MSVLSVILRIIYKSSQTMYENTINSMDTLDEVASDPVKLILDQKFLIGTTTQTNRVGEAP